MSAEENKALVRRYIEAVWYMRNTAALDEFLAPNYKRYLSPTPTPLTREGQRQRITGFHSAFPDMQLTSEDLFAEGDSVAFRSTIRGTHQGLFPFFQGMALIGKQVTVSLLDVVRIENGKFVEHWGGPDLLDLLQQLGVVVFRWSGKEIRPTEDKKEKACPETDDHQASWVLSPSFRLKVDTLSSHLTARAGNRRRGTSQALHGIGPLRHAGLSTFFSVLPFTFHPPLVA